VVKEQLIAASLMDFGFGGVIEVTNGISGNYGVKARQALKAKHYLDSITRKQAKTGAGLAYIRSNTEPIYSMGINALIQISEYEAAKLERVLGKSLDSSLLSAEQKNIVELMLKNRNSEIPLKSFVSGEEKDIKDCARCLGIESAFYRNHLPHIKGITMEFYVGNLFDEEITEKIIFQRHNFHNWGQSSDADVIIACKEGNFYGAVENIGYRMNVKTEILTRRK
jgi:hypothetical protein